MTSTQQFIISLVQEGKSYVPLLIALLTGLGAGIHMPQPSYMKKDEKQ
jgi:hypothetical protein